MPNMGVMLNQIRKYRRAAGLTLEELGDRMGVSTSQIVKLERGERRLTLEWMERLAKALGVRPTDLIGSSTVPFIGWLRASGEVDLYGEDEEAGYSTDTPPDIPATCVALEMEEGALGPILPGALAYFDQVGVPPDSRFVGFLCIAWSADGSVMGGRLIHGEAGRWGMIFGSGRVRHDLPLTSVSPILWFRMARVAAPNQK